MVEAEGMEREGCLIPPRKDAEIEREFRRNFGGPVGGARYWANSPWLARVMAGSNYRAGQLAHLDMELADLIFLAVSQDNSCRYCYSATRSMLRILGFDDKRIRRVEQEASGAEADSAEMCAIDFARRFSRANPAPRAADRDALRAVGFSEDAIKEIAFMAASTVVSNRAADLPAVPIESSVAIADGLVGRLLRPLVARLFTRRASRGEAESLPADLRSVPFCHVPLALDGLPAARIQAENLKLAFGSGPLPLRARVLVFAVVARGLGSELSEREAKQLLAYEGLAEEQVDEVLAHLASAKLDPLESAILPFVRETIRVRPSEIRRQARKLLETIDVEQFADLVGLIGVANGTCRLSLFLCEA